MKITSAGIIRNEDKARTGVISQHSIDADYFDHLLMNSIDLTYEEYLLDLEKENLSEEEKEKKAEFYEANASLYLIGDWEKSPDGKYTIDQNGSEGFAGTYDSGTGNVCIEFSKHLKRCNHTSPCYVMSDGSGPCGDLDTQGNSVLAYSIDPQFIRKEDER